MKDFEYYFMMRKEDQAFPMIDLLDQRKEIIKAQLGDPLPRRPVLADYLTGSKDFVTEKNCQHNVSYEYGRGAYCTDRAFRPERWLH